MMRKKIRSIKMKYTIAEGATISIKIIGKICKTNIAIVTMIKPKPFSIISPPQANVFQNLSLALNPELNSVVPVY